MKELIRRIKTYRAYNIPLTGNDKDLYEFIMNILDNLVCKKMDKYPNSIFYVIGDILYIEVEKTHNRCYFKRDSWETILKLCDKPNEFKLSIIMKYLLDTKLNYDIGDVIGMDHHQYAKIKKELKSIQPLNILIHN